MKRSDLRRLNRRRDRIFPKGLKKFFKAKQQALIDEAERLLDRKIEEIRNRK